MRALGTAALATIALAAAPVAAERGKKACALVTAADASKALRAKVGPGAHDTAGGYDSCTYTLGKKRVVVRTRPLTKAGFDRDVHAVTDTMLQATNVSPNAWVSFVTGGISLIVWQQGTELVIRVLGDPANAPTIAQALAAPALSRL